MHTRIREISLVAVILLIVGMMIVPLSPWLMDLLVSANLGLSTLIFALALFQRNPLQFSGFPSVLLIATLYRLALNVSSTRLILTQANAGQIIGGFGGYIVGGDIIVGAVIFGVILMVLFLVITRGAERVAEVAARFTLDALPGMQMAIETDLRSKTISPRELTLRRETLERRSMYYGSLDGAMKFVRGDAMAALVITVINLVGGILIGVMRKDMPISEALDIYGRLTVGDGLVSMIPALLISTAAGLLVTRVAQGQGGEGQNHTPLGELFSTPRALIAAAAMMVVLSLAPGLPVWPFLLMAICLLGIALFQRKQQKPDFRQAGERSNRGDDGAITLDSMQQMLDDVAVAHPVLVREAVWGRITLSQLADLVAALREEGILIARLPDVLEALAREKVVDNLDDLLLRVRQRLASAITDSVSVSGSGRLSVITLDFETEQMLQSSVVATATGKRLVLPPDLQDDFFGTVHDILKNHHAVVLLVGAALRRPLQLVLKESIADIKVIAHDELLPSVSVDVIGEVSL